MASEQREVSRTREPKIGGAPARGATDQVVAQTAGSARKGCRARSGDLMVRPLELILRGVSSFYRGSRRSGGGATPEKLGQPIEALINIDARAPLQGLSSGLLIEPVGGRELLGHERRDDRIAFPTGPLPRGRQNMSGCPSDRIGNPRFRAS